MTGGLEQSGCSQGMTGGLDSCLGFTEMTGGPGRWLIINLVTGGLRSWPEFTFVTGGPGKWLVNSWRPGDLTRPAVTGGPGHS